MLTVRPVVALGVAPTIYCSYALLSFLGHHPDQFYMWGFFSTTCSQQNRVDPISPPGEFRVYKPGEALPLERSHRISPPVALDIVKYNRGSHNSTEMFWEQLWLVSPCEPSRGTLVPCSK